MLKRAAAGRPLREVPDAEIAATLRDFERQRSSRCGAEIAQARRVGARNVFSKSWLVRMAQHTCRIAVPLLWRRLALLAALHTSSAKKRNGRLPHRRSLCTVQADRLRAVCLQACMQDAITRSLLMAGRHVSQGTWLRNVMLPYAINERNMFAFTVWQPSGEL